MLAFIIIVLVAATLQSATGFGFAIMATPFFLILFRPRDAVQLNIILTLLICLFILYRIRSAIDKDILLRLVIGSLIGLLPGLLLFSFFSEKALKVFVGIIIISSVGLLIKQVKIKQSNSMELVAGIFSGLLTTSIGMGGPPLMIYFLGARTDKVTLHGTTIAYFVYVSFLACLLQLWQYNISSLVWTATLWALPFLIIGILLGKRVFARLNQELFRQLMYLLLIISGLYMLSTTLNIF